ncbi:MAG: IdeS/Mac family cysteine endopeptidase [Akkermansia sp.]
MSQYFRTQYQSQGASFMGEWKSYLQDGETTSAITQHLQNDANTCWYQVASNCIQYWQTYYGIFSSTPGTPYGYAYDKQHVSGLGGTLSLNVGKYFYDHTANEGGNGAFAFDWYFRGNALKENLFETNTGGFYRDWFAGVDAFHQTYWENGAVTLMQFSESVRGALSRQGTLVELGISAAPGGHALTLYGYEEDENGMLTSLYVTNSDDEQYEIFELFVGEKNGKLMLYTDTELTTAWTYASASDWYIDVVEYMNTPEALVEARRQYDTKALQWTGEKTEWNPADADEATVDVLPSGTGWGVEAGGTVYASWYEAGRDVAFTDAASSGAVTLAADVSVPNMRVENSTLEYTLTPKTGSEGLTVAGTLTKAGAGTAHLQLATTGGALDVQGGTLSAEGVRVEFGKVQLAMGAVLGLCDEAVLRATDSMTSAGVISVSGSGNSLTATELTLAAGSLFRFDLTGVENADVCLTLSTGTLNLSGGVGLEALNGTDGSSYVLFRGADDALFSALHSYSGTLTLSGDSITLVYQSTPTWTGGGTWTATETGSQLSNGTESRDLAARSSVRLEGGTAEAPAGLSLSGKVSMGWVTVAGHEAFSGSDAAFEHLTLAAGSSLASSVSFGSSCAVELGTGATLSLSGASQQWSALFMGEDSALKLSGEGAITVEVASVGTLGGTLTVGAGHTLRLTATREAELAHLEGAGQVALLGGADFRLSDSAAFTGRLAVGAETQASVQVAGAHSAQFELQEQGTLVLEGSGSLTQALTGSGTVRVAEGANLSFAGQNDVLGGNRLEVMGTATIGSAEGTALSSAFANDVLVSGGSLTVYTNPRLGAAWNNRVTLSVEKLELTGGHYRTIYNWSDGTYWPSWNPVDGLQHIGELSVSGESTLGVSHVRGITGRSMRTTIEQLSGDGTLRVENDSYMMASVVEVTDASAFRGDVQMAAVGSTSSTSGYFGVQALELANGELGTVSMELSLGEHRKAGLGLRGDVSVAGLDSDAAATYVYNGAYDSGGNTSRTWKDCVTNDEYRHELSIDTADTHSFAGAVLNGVDLYKTGSGTQRFTGDMSAFDGSVAVEAGTLSFATSNLSVDDLTLASGAHLEAGSVVVQGVYSVVSDTLEEYTPAVVDADLSLAEAQQVVVSLTDSAVSLSGHTLTLSESAVNLVLTGGASALREPGELTLFTDVSALVLGGVRYTSEVRDWAASDYFTGDWVQEESRLVWTGNSLKMTGLSVPEPATASLSLAALVALALRRRRRG